MPSVVCQCFAFVSCSWPLPHPPFYSVVLVDVVGTCFSYDAGAQALNKRLGPKLEAQGISCKLLFYAWLALAPSFVFDLGLIIECGMF